VPANPPFEARFRSKTHPGSAASGLVFSRLLAPPLAACMIPVMIGALAAALEGYSLWKFLYIGFPGALLVALLWARFRLAHLRRKTRRYTTQLKEFNRQEKFGFFDEFFRWLTGC
jgi:hypothetical protein